MGTIKSTQNPKIKEIIKLRKANKRKKEDLIVIEGQKEISLALEAGIEIENLYLSEELAKEKKLLKIDKEKIVYTDKKVFEKISMRDNPDGFLVLAKPKYLNLENTKLSKNPLVVILESVEKPGNLGAILRTADASAVDAVIITDSRTDIYNPNVIRASLGNVFTNQVVACNIDECLAWLKMNKIKSLATTPDAKKIYTEVDYTGSSAIVIGTEHEGLSDKWLDAVDQKIKIPMKGKIDSLNASVSTAVVVFEATRQRDVNNSK